MRDGDTGSNGRRVRVKAAFIDSSTACEEALALRGLYHCYLKGCRASEMDRQGEMICAGLPTPTLSVAKLRASIERESPLSGLLDENAGAGSKEEYSSDKIFSKRDL